MSLPIGGKDFAWPPTEVQRAYSHIKEWAAWWSGDPNDIAKFYNSGQTDPTKKNRKPSFFWGRRGDKENQAGSIANLHVPAAGSIAEFSADLLFAEPVKLTLPADADGNVSKEAQSELDAFLSDIGFDNSLVEGAEGSAALGGVYLLPVWDLSISERPFPAIVHPDNAVPTFRFGRLKSVILWEILPKLPKDSSSVYRHLESHEPDPNTGGTVIRHGLYKGTEKGLGVQVSLDSHPLTEGLGRDVEGNLETGAVEDGNELIITLAIDGLDVVYVPNMLPNRKDRGSAMGRSDFSGSEGMFDALDETWSSWMRDIRLGQSRIIVPDEFVEKSGRGQGGTFDIDTEIFTPLEMDPNIQEKAGIKEIQFKIRTEEHLATILATFERIVDAAGYAPQSFGLNIEGRAESGTALKQRERKTFATQGKKRRYWGPAIIRIVSILLQVANILDGKPAGEPVRPVLEWPDSVTPDQAETGTFIETLHRAQAASIKTRIMLAHPEWDADQVEAEAALILAEEGLSVSNPDEEPGFDRPPVSSLEEGNLEDEGEEAD